MRVLVLLPLLLLQDPKSDDLRKLVADHLAGKDVKSKLKKVESWSVKDLRAALAGRLAPVATESGFRTGKFEARGEEWEYRIHVPENALKGEPLPVLIDPGHVLGEGDEENWVKSWGATDLFVVRTKIIQRLYDDPDEKKTRYAKLMWTRGEERAGHEFIDSVFGALLRDLLAKFRVDPDRVYLVGLSQSGYWAWHFTMFHNDRIAAAAPFSAVVWHVENHASNFQHVKLNIVHADADNIVPYEKVRAFQKELKERGYPAVLTEVEGEHSSTVRQRARVLEWFRKQSREAFPKSFERKIYSKGDRGGYWVEALEVTGEAPDHRRPVGGISAKIEGSRVIITTAGVKRVRVWLNEELVRFDKAVEVIVNNRKVFFDKPKPDLLSMLERIRETGDTGAIYRWKMDVECGE